MPSVFSAFAAGFALSAALIVAIGAQNLFVLRQGLRREHVGPVVLFCGLADAVLIATGVGGVGAFLTTVPALGGVLSLGGAAFLACYAVQALRRAARPDGMVVGAGKAVTLGRALAATAGFTFLNPHVYLDTVLLMGVAGSAQPAALRPAFVVGGAMASLLWFAALGFGARLLGPLFARPAAWRLLDAGVGATMLGLAVWLLGSVCF